MKLEKELDNAPLKLGSWAWSQPVNPAAFRIVGFPETLKIEDP